MTRDVLQAILHKADGLNEESGVFRVASEHRVTFYLGSDTRGMTVNEVQAIRLAELHVVLSTKEIGDLYCGYEAVNALAIKPPKDGKKAGFA